MQEMEQIWNNSYSVAPGPIETKIGQGLCSPEMTLLGRLVQPEDIAKAVLFISSSLTDYLTGTTIDVNKGSSIMVIQMKNRK